MTKILLMAGGGLAALCFVIWGVLDMMELKRESEALKATVRALAAGKTASDAAQSALNEKKKEIDDAKQEREAALDSARGLPDADFWRTLDGMLRQNATAGSSDASGVPSGTVPGAAEQR